MSKIEITEQELTNMMYSMWHESSSIMYPVDCVNIIKNKIKEHQAKHNEVLDLVINRPVCYNCDAKSVSECDWCKHKVVD